jgi:hypothetical protein
MNAVERLRGDGPLARALPRRVVALPELVLLALGASLVGAALLGRLNDGLAGSGAAMMGPLPLWAWCLGGLVTATAGRMGGMLPRLAWPQPALLRAIEYGTVIALAGARPWTFAALAVLAYHHYDLVYAGDVGDAARTGPSHHGGWELRTCLVIVAAALGVVVPALAVMTVTLAVVQLVATARRWRLRDPHTARPTSTPRATQARP